MHILPFSDPQDYNRRKIAGGWFKKVSPKKTAEWESVERNPSVVMGKLRLKIAQKQKSLHFYSWDNTTIDREKQQEQHRRKFPEFWAWKNQNEENGVLQTFWKKNNLLQRRTLAKD